jgi:hypothetical protein
LRHTEPGALAWLLDNAAVVKDYRRPERNVEKSPQIPSVDRMDGDDTDHGL